MSHSTGAALRHAESLNRQYLLDQMPVACVTTDDASVIQYANQPAAELLNVSAKHLRGRLLLHFATDRAAFGHLLQNLPLKGAQVDATVSMRVRQYDSRMVKKRSNLLP